jgi:hypothetical protein
MPRYMLDTDTCSYIMKRSNEAVLNRLRTVQVADVSISVITKSELLYGVEISPRRPQDETALDAFLRHVDVLDFTDEGASHYAKIRACCLVSECYPTASLRVASAIADFMFATMSRNRLQATPVAICAAVGVAMSVFQIPKPFTLRWETACLGAPLMLAYFTAIGLRASFLIPSEPRAAWTFSVNGWELARANLAAVRTVILVIVAPLTLLLSVAVTLSLFGPIATLLHAGVVLMLVFVLAELTATTFVDIPLTRLYQPGHTKLRSRWPLYVLGSYLFAYVSIELELALWRGPGLKVLVFAGLAVAALSAIIRVRRHRLVDEAADRLERPEDVASELTLLEIGRV